MGKHLRPKADKGPCPCGNESAKADRAGCRNSLSQAGQLRFSGRAELSDDTLVLDAHGMPDQPVLYFQAGSRHQPLPFGDGLKCTGGPFVRLGVRQNQSGSSSFPSPVGEPISLRGMVPGPGVLYYQARYRDPAAFCTSDSFNYTNALTIEWLP